MEGLEPDPKVLQSGSRVNLPDPKVPGQFLPLKIRPGCLRTGRKGKARSRILQRG
jgi:hypothetical protein